MWQIIVDMQITYYISLRDPRQSFICMSYLTGLIELQSSSVFTDFTGFAAIWEGCPTKKNYLRYNFVHCGYLDIVEQALSNYVFFQTCFMTSKTLRQTL